MCFHYLGEQSCFIRLKCYLKFYFLDFRLRGDDTLRLARRGEASYFIRLKCYEYFLGSRLRGNDTLGLARQENGRLLHSANLTVCPRPGPTTCRG